MKLTAVAMVKDEADVIVASVLAMAEQVDEILVVDHGSIDGTRDLLAQLPCRVFDERRPGYYQSIYVSRLAEVAREGGADWIVPFDADEVWESRDDGFCLRDDFVDWGEDPPFDLVRAALFDHVATGDDDQTERNPLRRLTWRRRDPVPLPKVAVRAVPGLVIEQGNHGARAPRPLRVADGFPLMVRHFSNRSPEQFVRKVRAGAAAYAATDLPEGMGGHWRMFGQMSDEELVEHFHRELWADLPAMHDDLVLDPWSSP